MTDYFLDIEYNNLTYGEDEANFKEFECCTFNNCDFSQSVFLAVTFIDCVFKFYTLKLKGTSFVHCSLIAVDFMSADLTEVVFDTCDLYRSEFAKAIANKANLKTSYNYTIDPTKTKIKKAIFALTGLKGLLTKYEVVVE
jgi:uncharacterized protein YjbI with pentapeptide repeats